MAPKRAAPAPKEASEAKKPWEAMGISKATYYRKRVTVPTFVEVKSSTPGKPPSVSDFKQAQRATVSKPAKVSSEAAKSHETVSKVAETTSEDKPWQIKPGQVLNPAGRPKGSRNKLTQDFVAAMCEDFRLNGAAVVEKVRSEKPDVYLRVIAGLVPQQVEHGEAGAFSEMSEDELDRFIEAKTAQFAMLTKDDDGEHAVH